MNAVATISSQSSPTMQGDLVTASGWELAQRVSKALAASTLVPQEYRNNIPNCIIALEIANRLGASPLLVMQNLYVVHGRPGWSSQFLIATFNQCGRFSAMRFEFFGTPNTDGWGCRAWAIEKSTNERITGADITIALAKAEGWHTKSGSKWKTMPQQMLMYRAASWFVRAYAPELSMGLQTRDELDDVGDDLPTVTVAARNPGTLAALESELTGGGPALTNENDMGITAQDVHDALVAATTRDQLDEAADLIRQLPEDQQPDLSGLYAVRKGELAD